MNAVDLLKEDHKVVEELFKRVEDTPPSKHVAIFTKIKGELDTHAHIEETVFYPALKKEGKKDLVDIVLEGIEEHVQIKMFLKGIAALTPKAERFEPKLKVLIEDTRHHVKEEEREMFPMVEDQISAEKLEKLGERMAAAKVKYQKSHGIKPIKRTASPGMLETVIDKATKVVTGIITASANPKTKSAANSKAKASTKPAVKKPARKSAVAAPRSTTAKNGEGRTVKEVDSKRDSAWDKAQQKLAARAGK